MNDIQETVIEHCAGDTYATITAAEPWSRNLLLKLSRNRAEIQLVTQNDDGALLAHVPVKWIKISPPRKLNMTEAQKKSIAERLTKARASKTY